MFVWNSPHSFIIIQNMLRPRDSTFHSCKTPSGHTGGIFIYEDAKSSKRFFTSLPLTTSCFSLQLLRTVTLSERRWRARSRGAGADGWSDDGEEGFHSGDCDDEDECTGVSGLGPPPRRKRLRIIAGLTHGLPRTLNVKIKLNCSFFGFR